MRADERKIQQELATAQKTIAVATVSTVSGNSARAVWDDGTVSAELGIIDRGDGWRPKVGQIVVCLRRKDGSGFVIGGILSGV